MPIRLNLLAEAQALEELRRRDPAKRALWVGVAAAAVVLAWSSSLQLQTIIARGELNRVNGQLAARTNAYEQVLGYEKKLADISSKLAALQEMATNRTLHGTLLNALQQSTLNDVQLTRINTDLAYTLNEAIKAKTNAAGYYVPARPSSVSERVTLTLEAKDTANIPGDKVNQFKQLLAQNPYFQSLLGKTNEVRLTNLSPPVSGDGKPFVLFTLECRAPERTR